MLEALVTLALAFIGAGVAVIGWYSRLESKGAILERDNRQLQEKVEFIEARFDKRLDAHEVRIAELDNKLMEKVINIEKIVAEIRAELKYKK